MRPSYWEAMYHTVLDELAAASGEERRILHAEMEDRMKAEYGEYE